MSTDQKNLSETEQFFYKSQQKFGGDLSWHDLSPIDQMQFVECLQYLLRVVSFRKKEGFNE